MMLKILLKTSIKHLKVLVSLKTRCPKFTHNKKSQVFLVIFGQPVFKETITFKFLMEVFSEYF